MLRSAGSGIAARVTWDTLAGKPTAFPPAAHKHPWSDLTGVPTLFAPSAHSHAWGEITGKPLTFSPVAHTHLWADITDKPTTFAPATHSHSYAELTNKPTIPAATPLGTAVAKALGVAAAGASTNAAREDHVHPLPTGTPGLVALPNVTVTGTILLGAVSGPKKHTLACVGAKPGDRLNMNPVDTMPAGFMLGDIRCGTADQVEITVQLPAVIATYSIPILITAMRPT